MPGYCLALNCPCGFKRKEVWVGVSEEYVHSTFALCLECRKIVTLAKKPGGEFSTRCSQCGMKLTAMTDPGAWEPAVLQRSFPGEEPWMIDDYDDVRILCPKCRKYSLKFEIGAFWD